MEQRVEHVLTLAVFVITISQRNLHGDSRLHVQAYSNSKKPLISDGAEIPSEKDDAPKFH